jgi:hypothetical protein
MVTRIKHNRKKEADLAKEVKELKSLIRDGQRNLDLERKKICRDLQDLCKKLSKKHKKSDPSDPPWHYGPRCPRGG